MKRIVALTLSLLMVLFCLPVLRPHKHARSDQRRCPGTKPAQEETVCHSEATLRLQEDHPTSQLLQEFCDRVYEDTDGTLTN
jgi:TRAP-type C4-dicarboxylate transport system substrate-binding protein